MSKVPKLVVIVGETASGKSALALELARRLGGEIICADSTTVRKGVDIGSAKPTPEERLTVPHHMLDLANPDVPFTAAQFKQLAVEAIDAIAGRGKLPIMVGGSGLYVDGVIYDYTFFGKGEAVDRDELRANTLVLGLKTEREILKARIVERVDEQLAAGLEKEVRGLAERYGWSCEALKAVGYAQWREYFEGTDTLDDTRRKIIKATLDLAKRQRTWFKRNKSIQWVYTPVNLSQVVESVTTFLNS